MPPAQVWRFLFFAYGNDRLVPHIRRGTKFVLWCLHSKCGPMPGFCTQRRPLGQWDRAVEVESPSAAMKVSRVGSHSFWLRVWQTTHCCVLHVGHWSMTHYTKSVFCALPMIPLTFLHSIRFKCFPPSLLMCSQESNISLVFLSLFPQTHSDLEWTSS